VQLSFQNARSTKKMPAVESNESPRNVFMNRKYIILFKHVHEKEISHIRENTKKGNGCHYLL